MNSGKRNRALKFFPLVLGVMLPGLPFWPVFQDYGASFAVLPEPHAWEKEHSVSESHLHGEAGITLIYSFQPWGGVSLEASDTLIAQAGPQSASVQLLQTASQKSAGKKDIARKAFNHRKHRSLPPETRIFRLQHPNWMITS